MQTISDDDLHQLSIQASKLLLARNWMLCCAESCTGGWLAKCCTDIVGSSIWFERGFVTYSNQAKHEMLEVRLSTLNKFGAVSEQTVIEMAQGALLHSKAHISVAITGVAGPDGGTNDKPVGLVHFAWATANSTLNTDVHHFTGSRETIRRQAVMIALQGIIKNASD
ncbi:MAG: nicotinamide-nucleotide amidase [Methylophagaceae bacterium]